MTPAPMTTICLDAKLISTRNGASLSPLRLLRRLRRYYVSGQPIQILFQIRVAVAVAVKISITRVVGIQTHAPLPIVGHSVMIRIGRYDDTAIFRQPKIR